MKTDEANRIIAEFMGYFYTEDDSDGNGYYQIPFVVGDSIIYKREDLSSRNLSIFPPVWEKLRTEHNTNIDIDFDCVQNCYDVYFVRSCGIISHSSDLDITTAALIATAESIQELV